METSIAKIILTDKLIRLGNQAQIPSKREGTFSARLVRDGIEVSNLGTQGFLPWSVFEETIAFLEQQGGRAIKGDAIGSRLGEKGLALNTIEGHIAATIYGKKPGQYVLRRITPIARILDWAGLCEDQSGYLLLRPLPDLKQIKLI